MKLTKRVTALLMAVALCLSLLTACGSGSKHYASAGAAAPSEEMGWATDGAYDGDYVEDTENSEELEVSEAADEGDSGSVYNADDVKLIRRGNLSIESTEFDKACAKLEALVKELGGYLENHYVYQGSYSETYREASYTVRVPADQYEAFFKGVEGGEQFHVINRSESTEDVGNDYADKEAHLKALKSKRERLDKLMEQAETMEDIITIENAISDTDAQIERYSKQLTRYDRLISYSTIEVSIQQVTYLTDTEQDPFLTRLGKAFVDGMGSFGVFLQNVALLIAGNVFGILLMILLALGLVRLFKWASNNSDKPKQPKVRKKTQPESKPDTDEKQE